MINEQRVLDEFLELVQIRCSTHDEREVADLLTKRLTELGGTVKEDKAGTLKTIIKSFGNSCDFSICCKDRTKTLEHECFFRC